MNWRFVGLQLYVREVELADSGSDCDCDKDSGRDCTGDGNVEWPLRIRGSLKRGAESRVRVLLFDLDRLRSGCEPWEQCLTCGGYMQLPRGPLR